MHVCVLGAGIVGLAAAYTLNRAGHRITLIDQGQPGEGTSAGNGAQLSYGHVQPLADASIWRQLPKLLLAPDSPLKVRPQLDPQQWRWALQFLAACNQKTADETSARLLELAESSRTGFDAMRADLDPDCDFSATGKLVLYATDEALAGARRQFELQRSLGSRQQVLDRQQCTEIEPALAGYGASIAGGVFTPDDCAADCLKVCRALAAALAARGVQQRFGTRIEGLKVESGAVKAVRTNAGDVPADAFVLALGAASFGLGREAGVRLSLYPLKGYSITLDVGSIAGSLPQVSVTDSTRKVVFARIGNRLRIAGMAEIVGHDPAIPEARIETLQRATEEVFPQLAGAPLLERWAGMRPATPTGRPIVGRLPGAPKNLLFNTGHGALGFTLAFGTAQRIERELSGV